MSTGMELIGGKHRRGDYNQTIQNNARPKEYIQNKRKKKIEPIQNNDHDARINQIIPKMRLRTRPD